MDKSKRKTKPIRKYILIALLIIGIVVLGFCGVTLYTLSQSDIAFGMGGDCVESGSYDSLLLSGSIIDLQESDIIIQVKKAKGPCPQSVDVDELVEISGDGNFSSRIPSHLGDNPMEITISAEGLRTCRFNLSIIGHVDLSLDIRFQEMWEVSGTRTTHHINQNGDPFEQQTMVNYECE